MVDRPKPNSKHDSFRFYQCVIPVNERQNCTVRLSRGDMMASGWWPINCHISNSERNGKLFQEYSSMLILWCDIQMEEGTTPLSDSKLFIIIIFEMNIRYLMAGNEVFNVFLFSFFVHSLVQSVSVCLYARACPAATHCLRVSMCRLCRDSRCTEYVLWMQFISFA